MSLRAPRWSSHCVDLSSPVCFRGHSGVAHLVIGYFVSTNPVLPSSFGYLEVRIRKLKAEAPAQSISL